MQTTDKAGPKRLFVKGKGIGIFVPSGEDDVEYIRSDLVKGLVEALRKIRNAETVDEVIEAYPAVEAALAAVARPGGGE